MADAEHLKALMAGPVAWNWWRERHARIHPDFRDAAVAGTDLRGAELSDADLSGADLRNCKLDYCRLRGATLSNADLTGAQAYRADFWNADLSGVRIDNAELSEVNLAGANLSNASMTRTGLAGAAAGGTDFSGAVLTNSNLWGIHLEGAKLGNADLSGCHIGGGALDHAVLHDSLLRGANLEAASLLRTDFSGADLTGANLSRAQMIETNVAGAKLSGSRIYGLNAWDVQGVPASQEGLIITREGSESILVDNLKIAHFIYLILNNSEVRGVFETLNRKLVLLLGRFRPDRKIVLETLRAKLRLAGYVPMLFDFEGPDTRDRTETIRTLALMSRFVIADVTEPASVPKELEAIAPTVAAPILPIIEGQRPYSLLGDDAWKYDWILPTHTYVDLEHLVAGFEENIIRPVEMKWADLLQRRRERNAVT